MPNNAAHIPILLIDMAGFSRLKTPPEQRAILTRLDNLLLKVLKTFSGHIDPRRAFDWQSTGDGYYITLEGCSTPVAMRFAQDLEDALLAEVNPDYPLRLRVGLVLGDVEVVGIHGLSQAKTEANRLVDHDWTRAILKERTSQPLVVVASALFMSDWQTHPDRDHLELVVRQQHWSRIEFLIKHEEQITGYVQVSAEILKKIKQSFFPNPVQPSVGMAELMPWLQRLLEQTGTLEIRGISSGVGRNREAMVCPIEQLYIPLYSRGGEISVKDQETKDGKRLADLLPDNPRLLIEGQPGAGKTTFLRLAAAMLCKDWLGIPCSEGSWRGNYLGLPDRLLVPVFLRFSQLGILLAKDPTPLNSPFRNPYFSIAHSAGKNQQKGNGFCVGSQSDSPKLAKRLNQDENKEVAAVSPPFGRSFPGQMAHQDAKIEPRDVNQVSF
ncbi:MAG: hypothetical protein G8345_05630, partial [Magnetococcales bacterium]|nr:hypothetical protein [Magnetococcales bacterium]